MRIRYLLDALVRIEAEHEHFEAHVAEIVALVERDDVDAATTLWTDQMAEEVTAMSAALDLIEGDIEVRTHETAASFDAVLHAVEARIRSLQNVMIRVLALATFLAFGIGFFTANTISQPIEQLSPMELPGAQGLERRGWRGIRSRRRRRRAMAYHAYSG